MNSKCSHPSSIWKSLRETALFNSSAAAITDILWLGSSQQSRQWRQSSNRLLQIRASSSHINLAYWLSRSCHLAKSGTNISSRVLVMISRSVWHMCPSLESRPSSRSPVWSLPTLPQLSRCRASKKTPIRLPSQLSGCHSTSFSGTWLLVQTGSRSLQRGKKSSSRWQIAMPPYSCTIRTMDAGILCAVAKECAMFI